MFAIIVVGGAKQGKTPFIKDYSKEKNLLVFDVQNEYGNKVKYPGQIPLNLPTDNTKARSRFIDLDVDKFMDVCNKKKNTICVFEEATMFFQGMTGAKMRKLIFSKAHTGNVYIMVFHSINSIPPRMMEGTDYVILFKTNDEEHNIERKFPRLLPYYLDLQKTDGKHFKIKTI